MNGDGMSDAAVTGALPAEPSARSGELRQLLATEQRLESRIAEARREADRLIREARAEAAERLRRLAGELELAGRALRAELEASRDRELADIEATARRELACYEAVDDAAVRDLAALVIQRAMGSPGAGAP